MEKLKNLIALKIEELRVLKDYAEVYSNIDKILEPVNKKLKHDKIKSCTVDYSVDIDGSLGGTLIITGTNNSLLSELDQSIIEKEIILPGKLVITETYIGENLFYIEFE